MRGWLLASARLAAASALFASPPASASFLQGEALDRMADIIALVVLLVVPLGLIALFWMVHVIPEKIAERRHHPQKDAIKTLCLLSLVFGGLLWPLAWLWAYTKPVGYRAAYGTEKHDDYYLELGHQAREGELSRRDFVRLRNELDSMAARGALPETLDTLRVELDEMPLPPEAARPAIPPIASRQGFVSERAIAAERATAAERTASPSRPARG